MFLENLSGLFLKVPIHPGKYFLVDTCVARIIKA